MSSETLEALQSGPTLAEVYCASEAEGLTLLGRGKFSVVHRGVGDLAGTWNDSNLQTSSRPRELVVRVELPELSSAAEISPMRAKYEPPRPGSARAETEVTGSEVRA